MKRVHLLPNVITAFSLTCGLFIIFRMNMIPVGEISQQILIQTAGIFLLAALADLLDGAVARVIKAESEFGGFFDSLSDSITFGVAPSVVILKSFSLPPGSEQSFLMTTACMVYSVCGVLRLVRYNVTKHQISGDAEMMNAYKKNFTGLPIPAAAAAAISGNLFLFSDDLQAIVSLSFKTKIWLVFTQMLLLGYFMICRLKFPSLKTFHIKVASFQLVFLTVVTAVLVFYGILNHFPLVFFILSWLYLTAALVLSLIRLISGRKSKTLEDYEPEPEEEDID